MRKSIGTLAILPLVFFGGAGRLDASSAPERFVNVEVEIGRRHPVSHIFRVPVVNLGERKFPSDKWKGVGWVVDDCWDDNGIGCQGSITVFADALPDDKIKMTVALEYSDKKRCNQTKEFEVVDGNTTKLKLKCGAKVRANYNSQRKTVSQSGN